MTEKTEVPTVEVPLAVGDPETGYFINTPHIPDRKWPTWTLRPYFSVKYPAICERWDKGGEPNDHVVREMNRFLHETHRHVGNGVLVFEHVENDTLYILSIVCVVEFRNKGHVGRYLDTMRRDRKIVFPEVTDLKLAQMLHRRGFVCTVAYPDGETDQERWIPVHIRGFDPMPPLPDITKGTK